MQGLWFELPGSNDVNWVSVFVVFSVSWFLALYCLLPIGVRSQEEAGDDVPEGAMAGAPSKTNLRIKAIGATVIAALVTALIYYLVNERILTMSAIDSLFGWEE